MSLTGVALLVLAIVFANSGAHGWDFDYTPAPFIAVIGGILLAIGLALFTVFFTGKKILALVSGLILGAAAMSLAYLYPIDTTAISKGILSDIRVFLESYKQYLLLPIAGCAISLGVIFGRQNSLKMNL